jgi:signal transduction histidine kinase
MCQKPGTRIFCAVLLSFPFLGACVRPGESSAPETPVQEIMVLWMTVERSFLTNAGRSPGFIKEIDEFAESVRAFLDSRMYRAYRYMPLSRPEESAGSGVPSPPLPREPRGAEEFQPVKESIGAFKEAVVRGDREKALALMLDIREFLIRLQHLDLEAKKFISSSYFALFLVFTFFIAAVALTLWFLHGALEHSLSREQRGSVFSRALVLAQEQERSRIAGELHDTVAQDLRWLFLSVGKIGRTADAAEREKLCREVTASQENLMNRVRDICDSLMPPDFRFQGLPNALMRLCYDFGGRTGIDCRIDIAENLRLDSMNEEMQLQAFRIVQEALTNVEKHAGATEAIVTVRNSDLGSTGMDSEKVEADSPKGDAKVRGIFISISDDGQGFQQKPGFQRNSGFPPARASSTDPVKLDAPPEGPPGHFGIRGMFERCAILNGTLIIESQAGEGTIVYLEAPLNPPPAPYYRQPEILTRSSNG